MVQQLQRALVILRLNQLEKRIGLQRSSIYEKMNPKSKRYDSTFPCTVLLRLRSVGWYQHEVED